MESFSGVRYRESSRVSIPPEESLINRSWTAEPRALSIFNLSHGSENSFLRYWTDFITAYGKMTFSFEKDRLVAMQGVIDRLVAMQGIADQLALKHTIYSAGVFFGISINQLLWTKAPEASNGNIPKHQIYPSWSWASMSGTEICFENEMLIESTEMAKLDELEKFDVFDRKGEMQMACRLTTRGVLRGLKLSRQAGMPYASTIPCHTGDFSVTGAQRSSGAPHFPSKHLFHLFCDKTLINPSSYHRIFCLGLVQKESSIQTRDVYGLLLEPTGRSGEYRRIGAFRDCCNNWCWSVWKKSPATSVRII